MLSFVVFTASQPHRPPRLLEATRTFRQPITQKTSHPTRPAPLPGARRRLSTLDCKLSLFSRSFSVKFNHCHSCRKTPGVYPPCLRRDLLNCRVLPPAQLARLSVFPTNSFVLTSLADPALDLLCFDIVAKTWVGTPSSPLLPLKTKSLSPPANSLRPALSVSGTRARSVLRARPLLYPEAAAGRRRTGSIGYSCSHRRHFAQ